MYFLGEECGLILCPCVVNLFIFIIGIFIVFFFIIIEIDDLSKGKNCTLHKEFLQRARSLLVVVSSPPEKSYENFTDKVREYNSKEPFNFTTPLVFSNKYIKVRFVN